MHNNSQMLKIVLTRNVAKAVNSSFLFSPLTKVNGNAFLIKNEELKMKNENGFGIAKSHAMSSLTNGFCEAIPSG